jgi:hypothetical protein
LLSVDVFLDQSHKLKERVDLDALHRFVGCRHDGSGASAVQEAELEWSLQIAWVNGHRIWMCNFRSHGECQAQAFWHGKYTFGSSNVGADLNVKSRYLSSLSRPLQSIHSEEASFFSWSHDMSASTLASHERIARASTLWRGKPARPLHCCCIVSDGFENAAESFPWAHVASVASVHGSMMAPLTTAAVAQQMRWPADDGVKAMEVGFEDNVNDDGNDSSPRAQSTIDSEAVLLSPALRAVGRPGCSAGLQAWGGAGQQHPGQERARVAKTLAWPTARMLPLPVQPSTTSIMPAQSSHAKASHPPVDLHCPRCLLLQAILILAIFLLNSMNAGRIRDCSKIVAAVAAADPNRMRW